MWDPSQDPIVINTTDSLHPLSLEEKIIQRHAHHLKEEKELYEMENFRLRQIQGDLSEALRHIFEYESNAMSVPVEPESPEFYEISYDNFCKRMEIRNMLYEISQKINYFEIPELPTPVSKFLEIVEV